MNYTTSETEIEELHALARAIRLETLKALTGLGFGHYGGCMSVVETLAVLYGSVMRIDPADPTGRSAMTSCCRKGTPARRCTARWRSRATSRWRS